MSNGRTLHRWLPLLLLAIVIAGPPPAHAQRPLRVRRVDSSAGLSHNSVYAVLRDRHGFVWAGTPDGLNRFDGYEIRRFHHDPDDRGSLSHQVIRCLLEDRDGTLWIGTGNALDRLDRSANHFHHQALDSSGIHSLFEDRKGTLWVGTGHGVFRRARKAKDFVRVNGIPRAEVRDFSEGPDGTVWALARRGAEAALHALDGSQRTLVIAASWQSVTSFAFDANDRIWLKPPRPAILRDGFLEPEALPVPELVVNRIRIAGGEIWMATDRGLCHGAASADVACRPIDARASWLDNYVRDLWIDDEGAVWFGTYAGLSRFNPASKPFQTWTHDERDPATISSDAVSSIVAADDDVLWIGTFGGGLNRLDRKRGHVESFRAASSHDALPHDRIWALLLDPQGILWIGTEEGLASFDTARRRFARHALPFPTDEREGKRTSALARDRNGVLWIAATGGLYSYDPRTGASRRLDLPHAENVAAIFADADGVVWTGTGAHGLRSFDSARGTFRDFLRLSRERAPLSSEGFFDIHDDGRGSFWIATGMGLSRFDRSTSTYEHFLPRDGLPASMIYSIAADGRGRLWLGTSRGLVRFEPGAPRDRRFRTFDLSDGLASLEFNRHAAARTSSGDLCFGGIGGLTCFDPERITDDPHPPRVALTAIEIAEGTRTAIIEPFGRESIELQHENDPFAFTFAALSFADPLRNRYQYMLEGFDRSWIDAGTRRLARYTNVPPGRYVFRVRASNADLVWNAAGIAMAVRILPPFWMTWWFRALGATAVLSLGYALYRRRIASLLEVEKFRLRIAGDLHDEVTSELAGISMLAELVRRRLPNDPAESQLRSLRDRASALASVMRDLAWGIHPEHDTAGGMIRRMRSTGAMLLGETPLRVETEGIDEDAPLAMLARRTLFLVFKEALHNIAKHAGAGEVTVRLRRAGRAALELTVIDDGAGFDPAVVEEGDGLRNMRRRVDDAGGTITVESTRGRGTTIVVRV